MRPTTIIMVLVAGVVALIAAFSVNSLMDRQVAQAMRSAESADSGQVLVAARPVGAGSVLVAEDFRYDKWPKSAIGKQNLVRKDKIDPAKDFIGHIARFDLASGQPIGETSVHKVGKSGKLAGMLDPGMRAVTINVTAESSVAGLASPGDKVDVVLSADMSRAGGERAKKSSEFLRYTAETVLENVKLLAIDQAVTQVGGKDEKGAPSPAAAAKVGKTATLEVNAQQAEILILAGQMGKLSLILRSMGTKEGDTREGEFTSDLKVSGALNSLLERRKTAAPGPRPTNDGGAVTVNRGGKRSSREF